MAMAYSTTVRSARMQAVADAIDGGAGAGYVEICTTSYASVLATITMADPCGSVSSGVLTFDCSPAIADSSADNTAKRNYR